MSIITANDIYQPRESMHILAGNEPIKHLSLPQKELKAFTESTNTV